VENPADRRAKTIKATDEALELASRLIDLRLAGLEEFARSLEPEERAALADALKPIVAREDVAPMCGAGAIRPHPAKTSAKDPVHA
jgi:hypothetical protein